MAKAEEKMQNNMNASVHSIYSQLLSKRQQEREEKRSRIEEERAQRKIEEDEKYTNDDGTKMSKKEKQEAALNNWQDIITNLTGDDLEYKSKKKNKKKYRKWIDDDTDGNTIITAKAKKVKKKNYNKEFEPELNMLRSLIADQNKFNADLWKRWQLIMGPAAKDSQVPTKTMVDMAAALNAGRSNALSMLNNIGNIKKTIADLTMKQKKLDSELGGAGIVDNTDLALLGSSIGANLLGDFSQNNITAQPVTSNIVPNDASMFAPTNTPSINTPNVSQQQNVQASVEVFDPNSWGGHNGASDQVYFESIPHSIVVEKNGNGDMRFKAVRDDTGEELIGAPVPDYDFNRLSINEQDGVVRGQFDEIYKIENVN